jgi:CRISPR system Cascade subunit CasE
MNAEPCWLSRIVPRPDINHKQLVAIGSLDPYGQHQALWKLFKVKEEEKTKRAEFLFRAEQKNGLPVFYVLSGRKPEDGVGLWQVESKRYTPNIEVGDQLIFKLRANPIVNKPSERGKRGKRHDVVMNAKREMKWKDIPIEERPTLARVAYKVGSTWLRKREGEHGCTFDEKALRVDGYQTWRKHRGKGIVFSTLDFEGHLVVTEQTRFLKALLEGVGSGKGFGCGLLLVKRV